MTLAEKACGAAGLPLGHGARVWTVSEVKTHLEAHLPAGHIVPRKVIFNLFYEYPLRGGYV